MEERRHAVRRPVAWVVRLWLNELSSIGGRAADASTHGLWVCVNWLPSGTLRSGRVYRVEVELETGERRTYAAALRRRDLAPPPAGRRTERRLTPTAGDLHQLGWTLVRPGPPRAN